MLQQVQGLAHQAKPHEGNYHRAPQQLVLLVQGLEERTSRAQVGARGVEVEEGRPYDGEILAPRLDHLTVNLCPRAEPPPAGAGARHRRERGFRERQPGAVHPSGSVQRVEDAPALAVARNNGVS